MKYEVRESRLMKKDKMRTQSADGFWIPLYTKLIQFILRSRSTTTKEIIEKNMGMKMGKLLMKKKRNWENLVTKTARVLIPIPIPFIMPFLLNKRIDDCNALSMSFSLFISTSNNLFKIFFMLFSMFSNHNHNHKPAPIAKGFLRAPNSTPIVSWDVYTLNYIKEN